MSEMSNAGLGAVFGQYAPPSPARPNEARSRRGWTVFAGLGSALSDRSRGPGGYYNLGNLLGLGMGVAIQTANMADGSAGTGLQAYLTGSPSALAMSAATAIFIASGECYHRAFAGAHTNERLYRIADLLSGVGALALGAALFALGHPILAATAGLLHAAGKFGSAAMPSPSRTGSLWPVNWPDPFRGAVVASRLPAVAASSADLWAAVGLAISGGSVLAALTPATLLVCYLLWIKADLLLVEEHPPSGKRPPDSED